jgi:hypothetical protein
MSLHKDYRTVATCVQHRDNKTQFLKPKIKVSEAVVFKMLYVCGTLATKSELSRGTCKVKVYFWGEIY